MAAHSASTQGTAVELRPDGSSLLLSALPLDDEPSADAPESAVELPAVAGPVEPPLPLELPVDEEDPAATSAVEGI